MVRVVEGAVFGVRVEVFVAGVVVSPFLAKYCIFVAKNFTFSFDNLVKI